MRGGLAVTGTVTDPEGKPIAGAVVVRGDDPYFESGAVRKSGPMTTACTSCRRCRAGR